MVMRVLDLFSGIGGFSLGLKRAGGFQTVGYCEIDPYCQQVLLARQADGALDCAPICTDVRALDGGPWRGCVDVICGGFPCQDISFEGAGAGLDGERSGLWREFARLVREVRPRYVIVENVAALLARGFGRVLGDLAECGMDAEWRVLPACGFGAPHCRERVWIIAYPEGWGRGRRWTDQPTPGAQWGSGQLEGLLRSEARVAVSAGSYKRMVDGVPNRVDRLVALGNAVVPQVVEWIGRRILEAQKMHYEKGV